MKKIILLFLLFITWQSSKAGLIFDNGSGDKNDTLVIQFCLLDSAGIRYTTWDTAYVVQAYGGIDFNIDTLLSASNFDLNSIYPRSLMFEYRLLASDGTPAHLGAYTWWVLLVDNNNGADSHQMHKGCYYVNDDPIDDFLSIADTSAGKPLGRVVRDILGDSISSTANYILANPSNKVSTDNDGFVTVCDIKDGALDSADCSAAFYRAIKRYFWLDSLYHYNNDPMHRQANTILEDIAGYTDGDGVSGIDADIGNPTAAGRPTRLAWATDDSLGSGSVPDSVIARVDSIRWAVGMPMTLAGEKYNDNLHRKLGPYIGGCGDNNNIKDDVAALSLIGSGSEACTIFVRQNGFAPIQGARIVIRTIDQLATKVPGLYTGVDGAGAIELDAESYFISIMANNYVSITDTIIVTHDSTWNFSVILFDPGNPPSADLCRIYGWIYDLSGELLPDVSVSAEIPSDYQPVKYDDIIITPFKKETETDSKGYWQLDLFPNEVLSKPDSKYLIKIEYPSGVILQARVVVPKSASWQFK
jgi:hypothetical protein